MDIVVRTPHGDADVSITSHTPATTLGDVVSAVTGQAVPRLLTIDDRHVDATVGLDDAELLQGSVVATEPPVPTPLLTPRSNSPRSRGTAQDARHGSARADTGSVRDADRTHDELDSAPVDQAMFELDVEPGEPAPEVTIVPDAVDVDARRHTASPHAQPGVTRP